MREIAVITIFIALVLPIAILIWKMLIDEFKNK